MMSMLGSWVDEKNVLDIVWGPMGTKRKDDLMTFGLRTRLEYAQYFRALQTHNSFGESTIRIRQLGSLNLHEAFSEGSHLNVARNLRLVELALWVGQHDHYVACIPSSYSEFGLPCLQEFVAKMLVFPMFNYRDSRSSTYGLIHRFLHDLGGSMFHPNEW